MCVLYGLSAFFVFLSFALFFPKNFFNLGQLPCIFCVVRYEKN